MNFIGSNQGTCNCQGVKQVPTCQQYNQVVQTYNVEDIPYYINYNTHAVSN